MPQSCKVFKFLPALAAVVLGLALVAAPGRAIAQQATPAATAEKSTAAEPAKTEEKPSQEEQEHGFLVNGAVVKWMSSVTGWSRDTTAAVFLWFNFAIVFFGIAIPISRTLPKIFRKRSDTLSQSLEEARKATSDANARLSAVEAKLAGLDADIAKFRTQVEEESKSDEQRIKSSIEDEKVRIVASAEQELTVAAAQARRNLRSFAADLAFTQAEQQLKLSPETDKALIAEFVAQAGQGQTGRGGKN